MYQTSKSKYTSVDALDEILIGLLIFLVETQLLAEAFAYCVVVVAFLVFH